MGLISAELSAKLDEIMGKCFAINRMLDRGMSLLAVRWKLSKTAEIMHPRIAHAYTGDLFGDFVSTYKNARDVESIYPATPVGDRDYDSPLDFFYDYHKENLELQEMIEDAVDEAAEEGDLTTKKAMNKMLENLIPFTELSQTLIDVFTKFNGDDFQRQMFDSVVEKYINV